MIIFWVFDYEIDIIGSQISRVGMNWIDMGFKSLGDPKAYRKKYVKIVSKRLIPSSNGVDSPLRDED